MIACAFIATHVHSYYLATLQLKQQQLLHALLTFELHPCSLRCSHSFSLCSFADTRFACCNNTISTQQLAAAKYLSKSLFLTNES